MQAGFNHTPRLHPWMPRKISAPFDDPEWIFELVPPGKRVLVQGGCLPSATLVETGQELTLQSWLESGLKKFRFPVLVDGFFDSRNQTLWCLDVLMIEGVDLTPLPLAERKAILRKILPEDPGLRRCDHVCGNGKDLFASARASGYTGIYARKMEACYHHENHDWLQIDCPAACENEKPIQPKLPDTQLTAAAPKTMIEYLHRVTPVVLPHLAERPVLVQHTSWWEANGDRSMQTFSRQNAAGATERFVVLHSEADYLRLLGTGQTVFEAWTARAGRMLHPDWAVLSIDCREAGHQLPQFAAVIQGFLKSFDIPACPLWTGSNLEVLIPVGAKFPFQQCQQFAELVCLLLKEELPATACNAISTASNSSTTLLPTPYTFTSQGQAVVPLTWHSLITESLPATADFESIWAGLGENDSLLQPLSEPGVNLNQVLKGLATLVNPSSASSFA